jgi:ribosomal peptide maturation radical SAM protein 1
LDELDRLQAYGVERVYAVDNILDHRSFKNLLPILAERGRKLSLFFEVKSNLKRHQVKLLKDAGVDTVQPGIESLSTNVLRLMRKGVDTVQNIALLKWAALYSVGLTWNVLYGFPGETVEDYKAFEALVPKLTHLPPPVMQCHHVRVDRFSPMFFDSEKLGVKNVKASAAYHAVFPDTVDVESIAAYFDFDRADFGGDFSYVDGLRVEIERWAKSAGTAALVSVQNGESLSIMDTRPIATESRVALTGDLKRVMEFCESPRSLDELNGLDVAAPVGDLLDGLERRNLLVQLDGKAMSLVVPMDEMVGSNQPASFRLPIAFAMYRQRMLQVPGSHINSVPELQLNSRPMLDRDAGTGSAASLSPQAQRSPRTALQPDLSPQGER